MTQRARYDWGKQLGASGVRGEREESPLIKQRSGLLTFIMAVGVFGILNTEMGIVGVVPQVAERFAIAVPEAAMLVSAFALVVAIAGPTMPLLFSKMNRKSVMLLALAVFTLCNAGAVFAPTFEALMVLRVVPAAFHPLYVSMALALASSNPDPKAAARDSAIVFVGVSAGMVVGAPVASLLSSLLSLSSAMAFFAVVCAVVLVATIFLVPSMPVSEGLTYGRQLAILKKPLLWASILSVIALNGAMFGFYGYLSDFLGAVTGMGAAGVSVMLLVYGLTNMGGNLLAGRLLGSVRGAARTLAAIPFALGATFAALFFAGQLTFASAAVVCVLGLFVGIGNNVNQYLVSTAAPEAPDFANGLFLTAANLGITFGTPLCGLFITAAGTQYAVWGAVALSAAAAGLIAWRQWLARRAVASSAGESASGAAAYAAESELGLA